MDHEPVKHSQPAQAPRSAPFRTAAETATELSSESAAPRAAPARPGGRLARVKRAAYRHLLVPTDGSRHAAKGTQAALSVAKTLGSRLCGLYVAPGDSSLAHGAAALYGARLLLEHFEQAGAAQAEKALAPLRAAAKAAGVRCSTEIAVGEPPWRAVLRVARRRRCDLIVLASGGRRGGPTLDDLAARVLRRSPVAVLIVR